MADRTAAHRFASAGPATAAVTAQATGTARPASGHHDERSEKEPSLLGRGLEVADRVGTAVGAGLAAIEERTRVLTRLVRSGSEPAASLAAVRTLASFERSAFPEMLAALLPVGGPAITLAANLIGGEHRGEPVLRAVVRSLGESLGAEAGQRLGMVACGAEAAATEGAGAILCPAVAIVATSAGATLGGSAAVRVYDALGPEPAPDPPTTANGR
jgi:hypothetical protein